MDRQKMAVVSVIGLGAVALSIAAMMHSRRVLADQQQIYPPGTLELTQEGTVDGCTVRIDDMDVVGSVASIDSRGYDRAIAPPDWLFVELWLSIHNNTDQPVSVKDLCESMRAVEISTGEPLDAKLVWMRKSDALPSDDLAPGETVTGVVSLEMWQYALSFPFQVQLGGGQATWGVDPIDRDAPL